MIYNKLKGIMKEKNYSQSKLAKSLNITTQSLNAKLNGRSQFTIKEAFDIISILDIENSNDVVEIFFKNNIPKMQQKVG
ncbi:helix-turn-helix transcriptional regulator [Clostridium perfringens]|uniref:helix-turn-helix transcriptional regulator n=1 Tax=Clostridium perfringens TaxID=1502 RepID=UPI000D713167|nr:MULTISPECIES: helix-turn-helix transcriptional regulator [Clostridium]MDU4248854.1 helix-turn-helix transcriptional regulator [Thomasclavelia ramosa]ELC8464930.1 helix-turn-helix transcriptional regulator [Clostridium perfringens]MBO3366688.1 helix-turn-helix transcriptional regulator [Clostridium perfringens]MCR1963652.1 helix-turn-helix domain-containing protein [Clostridium perfringens]MDK0638063.1 helix-turn-helix transcriptional regulator [Clostridium perfringens]